MSRCLHHFSALCGISLILLATSAQPAVAQDPCAAYINNTPYYERCQQIQQQSSRIREEQERQSQRAKDVREERLGRFHDPDKKPPPKTRSKKDARAAAYEKIAPTPTEAVTEKASTIPVTPSAQAATAQPGATDNAPTPAMQGAGYIVIDPAKLTAEQLQAIMAILKQSSPQANLSPAIAAPAAPAGAVQQQGGLPADAAEAPQPFSQDYPPVTGREGAKAITLPDIGQGGQEVMEIEPIDPASLHLRP